MGLALTGTVSVGSDRPVTVTDGIACPECRHAA